MPLTPTLQLLNPINLPQRLNNIDTASCRLTLIEGRSSHRRASATVKKTHSRLARESISESRRDRSILQFSHHPPLYQPPFSLKFGKISMPRVRPLQEPTVAFQAYFFPLLLNKSAQAIHRIGTIAFAARLLHHNGFSYHNQHG